MRRYPLCNLNGRVLPGAVSFCFPCYTTFSSLASRQMDSPATEVKWTTKWRQKANHYRLLLASLHHLWNTNRKFIMNRIENHWKWMIKYILFTFSHCVVYRKKWAFLSLHNFYIDFHVGSWPPDKKIQYRKYKSRSITCLFLTEDKTLGYFTPEIIN